MQTHPSLSPDLIIKFEKDFQEIQTYLDVSEGAIVTPLDVLRAHYIVVDFCLSENMGGGVGGVGPKDFSLLSSAVNRQVVEYNGKRKWKNDFEKISTLVFGIVKNHPFHDANKRTALLILVYSLYKISKFLICDKNQVEDIIVYMAGNSMHLIDGYEKFSKLEDSEIIFFADYIRRNSRDIDKRKYDITYRELDRRLRGHGFSLENPEKNYIDILQINNGQRVLHTGFPGWSRQVAKGDMKKILDACNLTAEHGVDSKVFFYDEDPSYFFVSDYRAQIASLANR